MNIYVHSALEPTLRAQMKKASAVQGHALFFRDEEGANAQSVFQKAHLVMGNPPLVWWKQPSPDLQFWQLDSAGFAEYQDLNLSIPVCNMGDFFAWPCAETMLAGILAYYRGIAELAVLQKEQTWVGASIRPQLGLLRYKSVVILGAGTIGSAMRQMLLPFGGKIKTLARQNPEAELSSVEDLMQVLPETDLVINCLPGTAVGFFNAEMIAAMKSGSLYANVGRGNTVDEPALVNALNNGHLAGAVLDVTAEEPLPVGHPLWSMPNVILTQHSGGGQAAENEGKVDVFLQNLERYLTKKELMNRIDLNRGY
jgi:glyoxylate/hydroxypyruvate reductase